MDSVELGVELGIELGVELGIEFGIELGIELGIEFAEMDAIGILSASEVVKGDVAEFVRLDHAGRFEVFLNGVVGILGTNDFSSDSY
jgi:hypothetical protein